MRFLKGIKSTYINGTLQSDMHITKTIYLLLTEIKDQKKFQKTKTASLYTWKHYKSSLHCINTKNRNFKFQKTKQKITKKLNFIFISKSKDKKIIFMLRNAINQAYIA